MPEKTELEIGVSAYLLGACCYSPHHRLTLSPVSGMGGKHGLQTQKRSVMEQNWEEESTACVSQKAEEGPSPAPPRKQSVVSLAMVTVVLEQSFPFTAATPAII